MNDKDFLQRVEIGIKAYQAENIWDFEEEELFESFLDWMYKQYGIVREKNNGNS